MMAGEGDGSSVLRRRDQVRRDASTAGGVPMRAREVMARVKVEMSGRCSAERRSEGERR